MHRAFDFVSGPIRVGALLLALTAAGAAATPFEVSEPAGALSLEGRWKVRAGDDPAWARPGFDDSGWREVHVPAGGDVRLGEAAEIAWYRLEIDLGPWAEVGPGSEPRLALTLGKVDSAYEVYVNGIGLGGVGALPPASRLDYDRHRTYAIPAAALAATGRLVVALRVWKPKFRRGDVGSPNDGPFLIGDHEELLRREVLSELPELFLAGIILFAGLFYLQIYRRRPEFREYLWFFLLTASAAAYTLLRTQWRYALSDSFTLLKELEHLLLYLQAALFIQTICQLIGLRIGPPLRAVQWIFVAAGVTVAATPGLAVNSRLLPFTLLTVAVLIVLALWAIGREAWRGNPEARTFAVGTAVAGAMFANDIAMSQGWTDTPRLAPFGFSAIVLAMALSLANRFLRAFGQLEVSVERERKIAAELRQTNTELARFNYAVSHDLKNPLTTIKNFVGLLRRDIARGKSQRLLADLARVGAAADQMRHQVEALLAYSRAGRVIGPPQKVPLGDLTREVVELLVGAMAERRVEIEIAPDLPTVYGDRAQLLQVLHNLVANAVAYMGAQERPRVEVGVAVHGGEESFYVRDNGMGIEPQYHDKVFGLFDRLDTSVEGTGIGLALAKRVVEVHGGRIWVESEGAGRGSTFYFTLPRSPSSH